MSCGLCLSIGIFAGALMGMIHFTLYVIAHKGEE